MTPLRVGLAFSLALWWTPAGCAPRAPAPRDRGGPAVTTALPDSNPATAALDSTLEPGALATVRSAPVTGWKGPGNRRFSVALRSADRESAHSRRFGTITLQTALRARPLGQYPCSSCHLGRRVAMAEQRIPDAHQNIKPVHPQQAGAVCATCHAADNVELLVLKTGERTTVDEAYRLCAQCHFRQVEAWAGGGHGKRLDGWEGRRVVMGCTDCHDPHRPALEPRIPFRAPQLQRPPGDHP